MARPETILDDLDDATRERVDEALLSNRRASVVGIYRTFGLADRGVRKTSFYAYARRTRKRRDDREYGNGPSRDTERPRAMETLNRLVDLINDRIDAGDPKHMPGIASAMRAMTDCMRLTLDEQADERAAELHAARLEKLEPAVKDAISEPTSQGSKDLRGILEQVASRSMAIEDAVRAVGDVIWIEIDKQMRGAA